MITSHQNNEFSYIIVFILLTCLWSLIYVLTISLQKFESRVGLFVTHDSSWLASIFNHKISLIKYFFSCEYTCLLIKLQINKLYYTKII